MEMDFSSHGEAERGCCCGRRNKLPGHSVHHLRKQLIKTFPNRDASTRTANALLKMAQHDDRILRLYREFSRPRLFAVQKRFERLGIKWEN